MVRRRRFERGPGAPQYLDPAIERRPRRAVVDNVRRKIERALAVADAAEDLAKAAQTVLIAAEAEGIVFNRIGLSTLRGALARYREVRGH